MQLSWNKAIYPKVKDSLNKKVLLRRKSCLLITNKGNDEYSLLFYGLIKILQIASACINYSFIFTLTKMQITIMHALHSFNMKIIVSLYLEVTSYSKLKKNIVRS